MGSTVANSLVGLVLGCAAVVRTVWGGAHVVLRVACLLLGLMMAPPKAAEEDNGGWGCQRVMRRLEELQLLH